MTSPNPDQTLIERGVSPGQTIEDIYLQIMGEQPETAAAIGAEWAQAAELLRGTAKGIQAAADSLADWRSPEARNAYLERNDQVVSEINRVADNTDLVASALDNLSKVMAEGQRQIQELMEEYRQAVAAARAAVESRDYLGLLSDDSLAQYQAQAEAVVRAEYSRRAQMLAAVLGAQYAPSTALMNAATFEVQALNAVAHPGAFGQEPPPLPQIGDTQGPPGPPQLDTTIQQTIVTVVDPPQTELHEIKGFLVEEQPNSDPPPQFQGDPQVTNSPVTDPPGYDGGQPPVAEPAPPPPPQFDGQPPDAAPPPATDPTPPPAVDPTPPPALGDGVTAPPAADSGAVAPPVAGVIRPPGLGLVGPALAGGRLGAPPGVGAGLNGGLPGGGGLAGSRPPAFGVLGPRPPGGLLPPGAQGLPPGMSAMPPGGLHPGGPPNQQRRQPDRPPPGTLGLPGGGVPGVPGAAPPAPGSPAAAERRTDPHRPTGVTSSPQIDQAFTPPLAGVNPPVLGDPQRRRERLGRDLPPALMRLLNGGKAPEVGTPPILANRHANRRLTYTEQREAAQRALRERARELARRSAAPASVFAADLAENAPPVLEARPTGDQPVGPVTEVPDALRTRPVAPAPDPHLAPVPPADLAARRLGGDPADVAAPDVAVWEVETPGGPVVAAERPPRRETEPPALGLRG